MTDPVESIARHIGPTRADRPGEAVPSAPVGGLEHHCLLRPGRDDHTQFRAGLRDEGVRVAGPGNRLATRRHQRSLRGRLVIELSLAAHPLGGNAMSSEKLFLARAEILAVSHASATETLDRAGANAAIGSTIRRHGGVAGCLATLAQEFGEHPETAAPRMRWARQTVAALYHATDAPGTRSGPARSAVPVPPATGPVARLVLKRVPVQRQQSHDLRVPVPARCA